jgi:hypothetical protein
MRSKFISTHGKNSPTLKRMGYSTVFSTTWLLLLLTIITWQCKKDKFIETKGICPAVISTNPANGDTNVAISKIITATFNEAMDPLTINTTTFVLNQGASAISGTVTYSGTTATFTPFSALASHTVYTGTITTGAKDPTKNALPVNYVWSFTTGILADTTRPIVISTDPANGATNVFLNKIVTATFSEYMTPSSINATTFLLKQGTTTVPGTVTYAGITAVYTPTNNLAAGTTYTGTITTGVTDASGNAMAANYTWSFTTGVAADTTRPMVISTDPANGATNVALSKIVSATFSETMNPLTMNTTTYLLKQGTTIIPGTVTYSGVTAVYHPTNVLLAGTIYTATITTGATDAAGNALATNYTWSFTTGFAADTTRPTVISTNPANGASNVDLNKIITAVFSEAMNPLTINSTTYLLKHGAIAVTGVVSYLGTTATFIPSGILLSGTVYTATITTGVTDASGNAMAANYTWTFTTGVAADTTRPTVISTNPANLAINVVVSQIVTATFSEAMNPLTINASTYLLKQGANTVAGNVTYSGTSASYSPLANLLPGTLYTATITTGATDLAGNALAINYTWTFTTALAGDTTHPTVISTDPSNGATNVVLSKTVTATFSEIMDPTTIKSSSFLLKHGASSVVGVVTYSGITASFNPDTNLLSGTTYTATITTLAKDLAGNPLLNNYVWTFNTVPPAGPPTVNLLTAARFGILSGVGISNNAGFSVINDMDVGISPGARSSVTGFPPAVVVNGAIYCADDVAPPGVAAMLTQAKADLTAAYLFAEGATSPAPTTVSGDQGGKTLAPGIYKTTSTLLIQSGDLTLDAQGDVNATWIFQIASAFTTVGGAGGNVILSGGAQAKNIFWQVGSSATIGDYTSFKGNILALTSITMGSHSTATGRMLARNAAVVLTSTNIIYKP